MLPQLLAYEACIRHGSVTRAAEELSLAQPTVSCLIKKLSDDHGRVAHDDPRSAHRADPPWATKSCALCREVIEALGRFDHRRRIDGERPMAAQEKALAE